MFIVHSLIWLKFLYPKRVNEPHDIKIHCMNVFNSSKVIRCNYVRLVHDDVIEWKHFPRYWPFVRGIHRSPVNSPHKRQWRGALMFTLICARINGWVNNCKAGDLRRKRAHYDVIVMTAACSNCTHHFICMIAMRKCNISVWIYIWKMTKDINKAYVFAFYIVFTEMTKFVATGRVTKTHLFHIIQSIANDDMAT